MSGLPLQVIRTRVVSFPRPIAVRAGQRVGLSIATLRADGFGRIVFSADAERDGVVRGFAVRASEDFSIMRGGEWLLYV